ncbi:hypothetical protein [Halomarina litorea]|uniref:hypothetical protein n=1 Tax=Halomarina litorea TaxID=2961595 RepID=UPI0020C3A10B|nr:hypothetical protein [Halomarina sp. BCD28]
MNSHAAHPTPRFDGAAGVVTGAVGLAVLLYGLVLLPASLLGGLHVAAVGACFLAAVLVGSTWGRRRLGLAPGSGTSAAVAFLATGLLLAALFLALDVMSFGGPFAEEGTSSGSLAHFF